jgi:hypothetical protein
MTPEEREGLLERYASSFEALQIALFHIGTYGLDRAPEGEWTPRQIVHHLADTEVIRSARLRFLLAEGESHIPDFDERDFATRLQYQRPLDASLALLKAANDANIEMLDGLSEADWRRARHHHDGVPFTVEDWLLRAAHHCHEHADQLEAYANPKASLGN